MKRIVGIFIIAFIVGSSFLWAQQNDVYKPLTQEDQNSYAILDRVNVTFKDIPYVPYVKAGKKNPAVDEIAYTKLLEEAQRKHQGFIDIRDVRWVISKQRIPVTKSEYIATGTIIGQKTSRKGGSSNGIESALSNAAEQLMESLKENSTVAVLTVSTRDKEMAEFAAEEIEFLLVDSGYYKVVDRKTLDKVRREQNFQMGGEVDDRSAVSIGKMLGAQFVITGSISGSDSTRRLRLKALNVQTAEIVAMASEKF